MPELRRGPSSETYGILGRIRKDRWDAAFNRQEFFLASGLLNKAIEAYLNGFDADWRDAYPGINALTLIEIKDPQDPRREKLIPVVTYAVERRMAAGKPDYWDHVARMELAVLTKDQITAIDALTNALAAAREIWELESTARNLGFIRRARLMRNEVVSWANQAEGVLLERANNWAAKGKRTPP
ncbi:MAG: TRAFs-binding domain-containing protein [Verrucomicrobia bacterium]|nr:TRAFs-binding domain-containing protein [Verrucomicrobiota bacterium]